MRSEVHEEANRNPHYANYYKQQLEEKDKAIVKLKARIQKLMANDIHQRGHIRSFQFERSRSQAELGRARNEMQQLATSVKLLQEDLSHKVGGVRCWRVAAVSALRLRRTRTRTCSRELCLCAMLTNGEHRTTLCTKWTRNFTRPRKPSGGGR